MRLTALDYFHLQIGVIFRDSITDLLGLLNISILTVIDGKDLRPGHVQFAENLVDDTHIGIISDKKLAIEQADRLFTLDLQVQKVIVSKDIYILVDGSVDALLFLVFFYKCFFTISVPICTEAGWPDSQSRC